MHQYRYLCHIGNPVLCRYSTIYSRASPTRQGLSLDRAEKKQQDMTEHEKCLMNGTYERARESGTEQNYNMIDGCSNNNPKKPRVIGNRVSVLDRLHIKLEERKQKKQGQQQQQERTLKN